MQFRIGSKAYFRTKNMKEAIIDAYKLIQMLQNLEYPIFKSTKLY
jgi:hypothetical protein